MKILILQTHIVAIRRTDRMEEQKVLNFMQKLMRKQVTQKKLLPMKLHSS